VRRDAVVERRDERLHDAGGAVEGPSVAPVLHEVRGREVPRSERGGLVVVQREVHRHRHARHDAAEARCVVRGIAAGDHEQLGRPVGKRLQRLGVHFVDRRDVRDGRVQLGVQAMDERVRGGRERLAGEDQAAVLLQVTPDHGVWLRQPGLDLGDAHGIPVVGHRAGERRRALERIEPDHAPVARGACGGELARIVQAERMVVEEAAVEAEDRAGVFDAGDRLEDPSEGKARAFVAAIAMQRVPAMDTRFGQPLLERCELGGQRGRVAGADKDTQSCAALTFDL